MQQPRGNKEKIGPLQEQHDTTQWQQETEQHKKERKWRVHFAFLFSENVEKRIF